MRKVLVFTISIISLFLGSCSNDLEINAPWKDVTVVFGLLNKNETTHYIRISKAFLGEGDALQFASQFDSLYYNPDLLDVKVYRIYNGIVEDSFLCAAVTDIDKDPGVFAAPSQILYSFDAVLYYPPPTSNSSLNDRFQNSTYRLIVKNTKTGNVASAETKLVSNITLITPGNAIDELPLYPQNKTIIKYKTGENGKMYELFIRFKYREYSLLDQSDIVSKVVEINLGRTTNDNTDGGKEMYEDIPNATIYQALFAAIPKSTPENPKYRYADSLQFQINVAADDMTTYLNVNQPSNTVAQERPQYTNIENGLGLFSSRNSITRTKHINDFTVDTLRRNPLTEGMNWLPR
jgi:hypothetical protein